MQARAHNLIRHGTALCLLLLLGFGPLAAHAGMAPASQHYVNNALQDGKYNCRWNDSTRTLNVKMEPGTQVKGWNPQMSKLVQSAFTEWEQAMGGRLRFLYTASPTQADITVRWRQRSQGEKVGTTAYRWDGTNTLTDTDIELALLAPNGRPLSLQEQRSTALHEIGHALGIKGHSPSPKDIMYPALQQGVNRLTTRDIATIRLLYSRKADVTNPVGIHFAQYKLFAYHLRLGLDAMDKGSFGNALKLFRQAESYYSKDNRLPYLIGVSALNSKQYSTAIPYLEKAIQSPREEKPHAEFSLAYALTQQGSAELKNGMENTGLKKLQRAKQHYGNVVKNPKASAELRQVAGSNLSILNNVAAQGG